MGTWGWKDQNGSERIKKQSKVTEVYIYMIVITSAKDN